MSADQYGFCCKPVHRGERHAATAERLMRSRFSAFATNNVRYLLDSWHPATRPSELELDNSIHWLRLDILATTRGGMLDNVATVEFRAHFRSAGERGTLHEVSNFVKQERRWFYVDGVISD